MVAFVMVYLILIYGTFSQYIVQTKLRPDEVELFCSNHCGSKFGSILSEEQFKNIQKLSAYAGGEGIWIGLKANHHPNYKWIDESPIDYSSDWSGGIYPWIFGEPSGNGIECVTMIHVW